MPQAVLGVAVYGYPPPNDSRALLGPHRGLPGGPHYPSGCRWVPQPLFLTPGTPLLARGSPSACMGTSGARPGGLWTKGCPTQPAHPGTCTRLHTRSEGPINGPPASSARVTPIIGPQRARKSAITGQRGRAACLGPTGRTNFGPACNGDFTRMSQACETRHRLAGV